jgi:hypothetical protein
VLRCEMSEQELAFAASHHRENVAIFLMNAVDARGSEDLRRIIERRGVIQPQGVFLFMSS